MQHLLLLHGAIGAKDQMQNLAEVLNDEFFVHSFSFSGHGGNPIPNKPFSIELFAKDVLRYLQKNNIEHTTVFGYSMGGYVALYLAKNYPKIITKLITLATKFYWDESIAAKEIKMIDADLLQQKLPAFAAQLAKRHTAANWKVVLQKTGQMLLNLGQNNTLISSDYPVIATPCLLLIGDRDKMVTLDETVGVYKQLPNAQLCILPDTAHPIEQVDIKLLPFLIQRFLK